ncbi:MAG: hypothetical protein WCP28_03935 [Actinomycetes bacterium]
MRRIGAALFVCALGLVLVTGCSTTAATSPSGSSSATTSANASASASASGAKQAWVRGTHVTFTNGTGKTVQVGTATGKGDSVPETTQSALATGSSTTVTDDWKSASGSNVFVRVVYSDTDVLEMKVANPGMGTPSIVWRKGYSVYNWSSSAGDVGESTFDENTTQTLVMEGHKVTATRGGDDGDNKNWTITLND